MNFIFALTIALLLVASVSCIPKFDDGGFKPSSVDYSEKSAKSQDQPAVAASRSRNDADPTSKTANELNERGEPRFGFTGVGDNGVSNNAAVVPDFLRRNLSRTLLYVDTAIKIIKFLGGYGVSSYAPARIDLGGLLLGAVIGIGTILVIPKLLYVLSGSYGAYARSDDGGIAQVMTRLDDVLARNGIDTTSCMQRVACSYSKQAAESMQSNGATSDSVSNLDKFIDTVSSNPMLRTALQGTAIQEAMETGRNGQNCARVYRQCGFSTETVIGMMAKLAASTAGSTAAKTPTTA